MKLKLKPGLKVAVASVIVLFSITLGSNEVLGMLPGDVAKFGQARNSNNKLIEELTKQREKNSKHQDDRDREIVKSIDSVMKVYNFRSACIDGINTAENKDMADGERGAAEYQAARDYLLGGVFYDFFTKEFSLLFEQADTDWDALQIPGRLERGAGTGSRSGPSTPVRPATGVHGSSPVGGGESGGDNERERQVRERQEQERERQERERQVRNDLEVARRELEARRANAINLESKRKRMEEEYFAFCKSTRLLRNEIDEIKKAGKGKEFAEKNELGDGDNHLDVMHFFQDDLHAIDTNIGELDDELTVLVFEISALEGTVEELENKLNVAQ
jgi:predicted  nucleic acid-binding Zn-ribbon protein